MIAVTVPLALLAAFLFAAAAALQQRAAHSASSSRRTGSRWLPVLGLAHKLVRDRVWLLGWVTNLGGFVAQAAALYAGSIAVVQPLLVTQLIFALALVQRTPLTRDWVGGGLICAGLAVLLSVRGAAPSAGDAHRPRILLATLCAIVLIVVLLALARGVHDRPQERAVLVGIGAGICFAMSAVFITLTTDSLVHRGVAHTATDWVGYALAASTLTGLLLGQDAFAAGSLPTAVAATTITNPIASYLAGVFAFDVHPPTSVSALLAVALTGALVAGGVVLLAHSPTVHDQLAATH